MYTDPDLIFDSAPFNTASLEFFLDLCETEISLENPRAYFVVKYFYVATLTGYGNSANTRKYYTEYLLKDVNVYGSGFDKRCITIFDAEEILIRLMQNMADTIDRRNTSLNDLFHHVPCTDASRYLKILEAAANIALARGSSPLPKFDPKVWSGKREYGVLGALVQKLYCCR